MKFELSFTNKEVTPWYGMIFLKQMLDKIDFREQIENCTSLPVQYSKLYRSGHFGEFYNQYMVWNQSFFTYRSRLFGQGVDQDLIGNTFSDRMPINVIWANLHNPSIRK
jgi:hypothetical protein